MNDEYFFQTIEYGSNVLPLDLRIEENKIKELNKNNIDSIIILIKHYFLNKTTKRTQDTIISDVKRIISAILKNENNNSIELLNISRFSIVYRMSSKVLKIGFPKITYNYPKSKYILDSIIRNNYEDENKNVIMFLEVQDYKNNNIYEKYDKNEIEEFIYKIWKHFRKNNIIWFDPKDKNIVLNDIPNHSWDNSLYDSTNDDKKGAYKFNDEKYIDYGILIVDNDLFLSLSTFEKLLKLNKEKPNLSGFSNWKYIKVSGYENRYESEIEYENK